MYLSLLEKENIGVVIPFYFLSNDLNKDILSLKNTISIIQNYSGKIVVVDDGVGIPNIDDIKLIRHQINKGKSFAIRSGIKEILKLKL